MSLFWKTSCNRSEGVLPGPHSDTSARWLIWYVFTLDDHKRYISIPPVATRHFFRGEMCFNVSGGKAKFCHDEINYQCTSFPFLSTTRNLGTFGQRQYSGDKVKSCLSGIKYEWGSFRYTVECVEFLRRLKVHMKDSSRGKLVAKHSCTSSSIMSALRRRSCKGKTPGMLFKSK